MDNYNYHLRYYKLDRNIRIQIFDSIYGIRICYFSMSRINFITY